ncbi:MULTISPECIES: DUF1659 domain-containing protein [Desulfitobacterium]|uniref:DUF1659 domain-containing protein n=1 Tax=Desulfitobacterium dehalogenans (strain ATCC 51507 / DSM 9161 / JW/IU-DC1) TaxID=756499 RepID=I4A7J3_DESDJ|nr:MULTISPECIES: DUF1659 domain-containing protein [Desulfitobacterium]AFL99927.1 Protein of unknown function (DUF1659) [Desulfitobacterium dehalogenans ATCC 51507]
MAVIGKPLTSTLVLKYEDGLTPAGAPRIRQMGLKHVKPDADHADLHDIAVALFSLSDHPLTAVILQDSTELVEEPEG